LGGEEWLWLDNHQRAVARTFLILNDDQDIPPWLTPVKRMFFPFFRKEFGLIRFRDALAAKTPCGQPF